jgi:hypothetical protein
VFTFSNCIFRNCSFQRITMFASIENYENWKDNAAVNWLSFPPTPEAIYERKKFLRDDLVKQNLPIPPQLLAELKAYEDAHPAEQAARSPD